MCLSESIGGTFSKYDPPQCWVRISGGKGPADIDPLWKKGQQNQTEH